MAKALEKLAQQLGHSFNDLDLLAQALNHRSSSKNHNERLEFLGDAILEFIISKELYQQHQDASEGSLSRMRSSLVNRDILARLAQQKQLDQYINVGLSEINRATGISLSILADATEAVIAAIYLDGGIAACQQCVLRWYHEVIGEFTALKPIKDPKSQLQEVVQGKKYPLPEYIITKTGRRLKQKFTVICRVTGLPYETQGSDVNRRKAEQIAATHYLEKLGEDENFKQ